MHTTTTAAVPQYSSTIAAVQTHERLKLWSLSRPRCFCVQCVQCSPGDDAIATTFNVQFNNKPHMVERHPVIILLCTKVILFQRVHVFLRRPRFFSRALGCGARTGPACTPRCQCGSPSGSVARALGVQSREIWQVITGSLSAEIEPSTTIGNQHVSCFFPLLQKLFTL